MEKNEKNFCCLCGKSKNEPLTNLPLGMTEEGFKVEVEACHQCEIVLHNVRRVFEDVKRKAVKNLIVLGGKKEEVK